MMDIPSYSALPSCRFDYPVHKRSIALKGQRNANIVGIKATFAPFPLIVVVS